MKSSTVQLIYLYLLNGMSVIQTRPRPIKVVLLLQLLMLSDVVTFWNAPFKSNRFSWSILSFGRLWSGFIPFGSYCMLLSYGSTK